MVCSDLSGRRRYPLRQAIQAAVQIWEVESPLLSEQVR